MITANYHVVQNSPELILLLKVCSLLLKACLSILPTPRPWKTPIYSLLLEKAMAPHSSTFAWKIQCMEEPGRVQSMGSLRVRHDWVTSFSLFTFHFHALEKEMATHFSVLAWRIPGMGKPGGLPSMGSHRVGHDWSDLAAAALSTSMSFNY